MCEEIFNGDVQQLKDIDKLEEYELDPIDPIRDQRRVIIVHFERVYGVGKHDRMYEVSHIQATKEKRPILLFY